MRNRIIYLCLLGLSVTSVLASPGQLKLGQPEYTGKGCPPGSVSAVLSPDQQALSILFDSYILQAGGSTGKKVERKSCDFTLPLEIPSDYSIDIVRVDYRGFNSLPAGAHSRLDIKYLFAGGGGPPFKRDFSGPLAEDFLVSSLLDPRSSPRAHCGKNTLLRTTLDLKLVTNTVREEAMASVDSADLDGGVVLFLKWMKCD